MQPLPDGIGREDGIVFFNNDAAELAEMRRAEAWREGWDGLADVWREMRDNAEQQMLELYPHEVAILHLRLLELGSAVGSMLFVHHTYLLCTTPEFAGVDWILCVLSCLRLVFFVPRLRAFFKYHALFREARNQPTPQLLRRKLRIAMAWKPLGHKFWCISYCSWLCLVPCLWYYGNRTGFSSRVLANWRLSLSWFILSPVVSLGILFCLRRWIKLDRGMTEARLKASTTVVKFKPPWTGFGSAECGVCLAEYEEGEAIRMLPCGHHFHTKCVDVWLQKYLNRCPFCQAIIDQPSDTPTSKED